MTLLSSSSSHLTDGFFVEAGAFDGFAMSNTLLLETRRNVSALTCMYLRYFFLMDIDVAAHITIEMHCHHSTYILYVYVQWSGLLVEPNPALFRKLEVSGRNAVMLPTCLSTKRTPETILFDMGRHTGIVQEGKCRGQQGCPTEFPEFQFVQAGKFRVQPKVKNVHWAS